MCMHLSISQIPRNKTLGEATRTDPRDQQWTQLYSHSLMSTHIYLTDTKDKVLKEALAQTPAINSTDTSTHIHSLFLSCVCACIHIHLTDTKDKVLKEALAQTPAIDNVKKLRMEAELVKLGEQVCVTLHM